MKILLCSHRFAPDVGGIETVSALLAAEFARAGHEVRVLTQTPADDGLARPYQVCRQPDHRHLLALASWCDVFFQNNISLQTLWAGFLRRKPVVIAHHTWLTAPDGRTTVQTRLKRLVARFVRNIAISPAIARHVGAPATFIPNPLDTGLFRSLPGIEREREIVCVGRLVSDKGVDLLLEALAILARHEQRPRLTIVGTGPEEDALRAQAARLQLDAQVTFAGRLTGEALVRCLNAHRVIAVPSRWAEPFGLVALEGIACGCVAVGSAAGGLPEAIGPCGLTFPNGDAAALASALAQALPAGEVTHAFRQPAAAHLARHRGSEVAARYLEVLTAACSLA